MDHAVIGVGVVVCKEGRILMGKRKGSFGAGTWAFPGGHLEKGETPAECAARELSEETGLKVLSFREGPWLYNLIGEKQYLTLSIWVDRFEGEPKLLEPEKCEGWHWFSHNELPSPLFPCARSFFEKTGIQL